MSPSTLSEAVEQATNYEFAHFDGKPTKHSPPRNDWRNNGSITANHGEKKQSSGATNTSKPKNNWKKDAICHNCGVKGHISPEFPSKDQRANKDANHYVSGSFYAILEVQALASRDGNIKKNISIVIDNGSSLNGISEEPACALDLEVHEDTDDMMNVDLGYGQTVQQPRRTAEMILEVPGFAAMRSRFQVMPIPEQKYVLLGMIWLREQNSEIDWGSLTLRLRARSADPPIVLKTPPVRSTRIVANRRRARHHQSREIFHFYRQHGHDARHGHTMLISLKSLAKEMRKGNVEHVFVVNPLDSEKAERFKQQGWEALKYNPTYDVLLKYKDTVFRTELPITIPPIREGIEHEIKLKPGVKLISVSKWRQSPEQRKVVQEWTEDMVNAGIIRPSISLFPAPTFWVKKPVGWRIVHDYRQLNAATFLPAIPMPREEDTFDVMNKSQWFSCMDLLWGYYQVKLRESDIPFTAFSTPDGLFEYLVTHMGLSESHGTFNRLLQRVFSDLRNVMRIYFDDIYVFTRSADIDVHIAALDRVLQRCEEQELYVKLAKYQFCVPEIPCLGDFVGRNGVRIDPDKIKIVQDWPLPKPKTQTESFLGTTVYVSRFCADFAQFAGPLHEAIKGKKSKDTIELTDHQVACFKQLKSRLASPQVLRLPNFTRPFGIRMDASNFAIGGKGYFKRREGRSTLLRTPV
ncbi:unnamed protein product [Phytophthora fragariaefolia]|uniref:Unnamed protein product n=1 Tax=Phytophthora fragariaefolia TaxID=1490495 RepID=A0A9W6TSP9_9STRA|nr:unnamed protein product [Phytophthora fragariaefolia]